jgi:hypothetical protein
MDGAQGSPDSRFRSAMVADVSTGSRRAATVPLSSIDACYADPASDSIIIKTAMGLSAYRIGAGKLDAATATEARSRRGHAGAFEAADTPAMTARRIHAPLGGESIANIAWVTLSSSRPR